MSMLILFSSWLPHVKLPTEAQSLFGLAAIPSLDTKMVDKMKQLYTARVLTWPVISHRRRYTTLSPHSKGQLRLGGSTQNW
jgi:hypothetical protein